MMDRKERVFELKAALAQRVLVLDGAMGTQIQNYSLTEKDFGGVDLEGCNENLVITRPEIITEIHKKYLFAGADIIETNTFGGTPLVLGEFSISSQSYQINRTAAELARKAATQFDTANRLRFVAGSIGPTTKALSVTGGISFEDLVANFEAQAEALYDGGVDYFLIETCQDTRNIKAALLGVDRVNSRKGYALPIAVSGTIEAMGTMLAGQSAEALVISLAHRDLLYVGLNCATGPEFMTDHIRAMANMAGCPVACVPNAGLPDEDGKYLETPEMMGKILKNFGNKNWLNVIGGCCGTTEAHIAHFAAVAREIPARQPRTERKSYLSGIDWLEVSDDNRPIFVGERTNVIGSRKFKELVTDQKWDEASEIARKQIKNAAQIIDICLANPDRDEFSDMRNFLEILTKKIATPIMIDSTDAKVIEMALTYSQGKAIINSINLEDGEERFEAICPLARAYGAALVVGLIDDDPAQGMGVSRKRKLEIARRSYQLLTEKYGIRPEDIYWDALVFPCGTGDPQYVGSGVETIEAVKILKETFPGTKTVLGVSNVSFGLPTAGREVLNSVFLYHCTRAGLDLAIVNTEKLSRFAEIPAEEVKLCDDLLWNRGADPVAAFNAHFGTKKAAVTKLKADLPLDQRLGRCIVEGSKEGLIPDLQEAMKSSKPLDIINGPLMAGMDEVGRLFNDNKLIVAEVLQSAEVMKTAVDFLKPFMEKSESSLRGRVILATVKGDVHDIGKNLVDIILSNNGFEVINLGIKVLSQTLIDSVKQHHPQIVGLSGLLVKSAQQMVETAGDLASAGINTPILVGGAALTRNFVDRRIAPAYGEGLVEYANDAMSGLELAKQIVDESSRKKLVSLVEKRRLDLAATTKVAPAAANFVQKSGIKPQSAPPAVPDMERHLVNLPLEKVWSFINPLMLLGKHLGLKGDVIRALGDKTKRRQLMDQPEWKRILEIEEILETLKKDARGWMTAKAVYQYVPAYSEGDAIIIPREGSEIKWKFRRQKMGDGLCLSDFIGPKGAGDALCVFVTTCGGDIRQRAEKLKADGEFLKSHALLSLSLETAEAAAEYIHSLIRNQWGFPDHTEMTMMDRFQARYRGKRYSFGYPACPDLEFQQQLFDLLKPADIGVQLTEGFMMSPECSVSALVFSHPEAKYFGVGE